MKTSLKAQAYKNGAKDSMGCYSKIKSNMKVHSRRVLRRALKAKIGKEQE